MNKNVLLVFFENIIFIIHNMFNSIKQEIMNYIV